MGLTVTDLRNALTRLQGAMGELEHTLNAADAKLGDGDTGTMLARLVDALAAVDLASETDLGAAFLALAKSGASSTGSSLGTLVVTGLMTAGKATKGRTEVPWQELGAVIIAIRDAAMARGKAALGDKTVIDSLTYLARAIEGSSEAGEVAEQAQAALAQALDDFRDRPCGMGRARMFAQKSIGLDDPGMLAMARLTGAMTGDA